MIDNLRWMMRVVGRVAMIGLIAAMILASYYQPQGAHDGYIQRYDKFRSMLYLLRVADLPPARYIQGLFDYFYWVDLVYLIAGTVFISLRFGIGSWMMFLYFGAKFTICFLPHLVGFPRGPFTSRDRFQMMRQVGLLGAFLALTYQEPSKTPQAAISMTSKEQ